MLSWSAHSPGSMIQGPADQAIFVCATPGRSPTVPEPDHRLTGSTFLGPSTAFHAVVRRFGPTRWGLRCEVARVCSPGASAKQRGEGGGGQLQRALLTDWRQTETLFCCCAVSPVSWLDRGTDPPISHRSIQYFQCLQISWP